jgi:hypothetical protein
MQTSRRDFIAKGVVGTATLGMTGAFAADASAAAPMVAACGLSCSVCPLMKAGTCKGCGPGNKVAAEVVAKKNCPVLNCASMKKIGFCGTECAMFAKCGKLVGRPYAQEFLDRIAAKLG